MANSKLCAVPDCIKLASGPYCQMHRARLRRGGSIEPRQPRKTISELLDGRTVIGSWTIIGEGKPYERPPPDGRKHPDGVQRTATCRCVCGNVRDVVVHTLKRGQSQHCGCMMAQITGRRATTHGMSKSSEYRSWSHMKERCSNPNCQDWPDYGGRGITVCERWLESFDAFYEDMGPRPPGMSIDRIEVDGHYEPGNVRWADNRTQAQNKRTNRVVVLNGEKLPLIEACRCIGAGQRYKVIHLRMQKGETFLQAIRR